MFIVHLGAIISSPFHVFKIPVRVDSQPGLSITVNREIFAALKVGEFAILQLAADKIPCLLQKFNG
jgi:hypothetical protein